MTLQPDGDQPQKVEAETLKKRKRPPEPPKPDKSRRSSLASYPRELNPAVKKIITEGAETMISNFKVYGATDLVTRDISLGDPTKEQSRLAAEYIHFSLGTTEKRRDVVKKISGKRTPGKSKLTKGGKKESVTSAFEDFVTDDGDRDFAMPFGQYGGEVSGITGEVFAIDPGFKVGSQPQQLLGHVAQLFMNDVTDLEYQAMLVNDRLFISANAQETIAQIAGKHLSDYMSEAAKTVVPATGTSGKQRAYRIGAMSESMKLDPSSTEELTQQQMDGASMMTEIEVGHHVDYGSRSDLRSILGLLQTQAMEQLTMLGPFTPEVAMGKITTAPKYSVIGVKSKTQGGWHAEQNLAMMLVLAGWTGGAVVSGTKNPCYICLLTLALLPQRGFPLTFTATPGYIWTTNTLPGLTGVAKQLGITTVSGLLKCFENALRLNGGEFRQFMTALKKQEDLVIDMDLDGADMRKLGLTQDQSQKSFRFDQIDPEPELLTGEPGFPTEVPGSPAYFYGTPPSSPRAQHQEEQEKEHDTWQMEIDEIDQLEKEEQEKEAQAKLEKQKKDAL